VEGENGLQDGITTIQTTFISNQYASTILGTTEKKAVKGEFRIESGEHYKNTRRRS